MSECALWAQQEAIASIRGRMHGPDGAALSVLARHWICYGSGGGGGACPYWQPMEIARLASEVRGELDPFGISDMTWYTEDWAKTSLDWLDTFVIEVWRGSPRLIAANWNYRMGGLHPVSEQSSSVFYNLRCHCTPDQWENLSVVEINGREWQRLRKTVSVQVFDRDGQRCRRCGTGNRLSVDHVVPLSREGSNELANLQTLCGPCNSRKGARLEA